MKKTIVILSIILSLFSLSSCNLDNEGILWRNIDRTVSDNKNRNFIGATDDAFYFVTENGLEKGTLSGNSYSETVVLDHDMFTQFFRDFGVIIDGSIFYIDERETFYKIDLSTYKVTQLSISDDSPAIGYEFVDFYISNENVFLIGSKSASSGGVTQIFQVTLNDAENTVILTQHLSQISNFLTSINGLIYANETYSYEGKTIKNQKTDGTYTNLTGNVVKSFITNGNDYYMITNNNGFHIYKNIVIDDDNIYVKDIASTTCKVTAY